MTTPEETPPAQPDPPLTREEIAFLIKALWAALKSPGWTFKTRKDLEKLGEALFSGKELRELDDALYERLAPHLVTIATHLGTTLRTKSPAAPREAAEPPPAETTGETAVAATEQTPLALAEEPR
jgi:hypothetical protein